MAQNLNYASDSSLCYAKAAANCEEHGRLYKYSDVADTICPWGWHVPSDLDFRILLEYVGGEIIEDISLEITSWPTFYTYENSGVVLKSVNAGWLHTDNGDLYGFSAVPTGQRWDYGSFSNIDDTAIYWTTTRESKASNRVVTWRINDSNNYAYLHYDLTNYMFAVRCLKN
jgi:uncharacterized protein (TIGR02145 family)